MKRFLVLTMGLSGIAMSGCVTADQHDRDIAYAACETVSDGEARRQCIDDALVDLERARRDSVAEWEAERESLERRQAIEQAYGVPEGERSGTHQTLPDLPQ